ncbi:unnamed protein product [Nesidiocoris tenuis]|uniref:Uncharacterized protein n=1 Tax=Nesidiocoris tenuis TaxID=355587 RepID=A0A6H5HN42_9HEMI|nr:unnamed protein product [Nesidiocoris tenuis]
MFVSVYAYQTCLPNAYTHASKTSSVVWLITWYFLVVLRSLRPVATETQLVETSSLVTYAVVTHVAYRVINVSVLAYFLVTTETSVTLYTLLALVTVLKCLCATVHIVVILRSRELLLKLTSDLEESDFFNNVYRKLTNLSIIYEIYLYSAGQFLQKRWLAAFRDVFSSLDVLCPIFIILQYCTFLKIATNRLRKTRLNLIVHFYNHLQEPSSGAFSDIGSDNQTLIKRASGYPLLNLQGPEGELPQWGNESKPPAARRIVEGGGPNIRKRTVNGRARALNIIKRKSTVKLQPQFKASCLLWASGLPISQILDWRQLGIPHVHQLHGKRIRQC